MAIKSSGSKPAQEHEILRTITPLETEADAGNETTLRPRSMDEYVGQSAIKKHLRIAIDSARIRKAPLDHILFYGPPGLGKTTLSVIIASEMSATIKHTSGPAIEKQSDLVSILTSLQE
jgi:Holliday junction DNA helicase RuvB